MMHYDRSFMPLPHTGIDHLLANTKTFKNQRIGILSNQSCVTHTLQPTAYALCDRLPTKPVCLFVPEHGWSAFCPAGDDIKNTVDISTSLPIYSLYGKTFKTNLVHMETLDILIIDLQDVGVRCYTYAATCARVLEYISQKCHTHVVICDRPNPLGSLQQGPRYHAAGRSIVHYCDILWQHGLSLGEILSHFNNTLSTPVGMTVIPYADDFNAKDHLWIPPSPGLVQLSAVFLYPGLVLLEGTNISMGRGSTLPFQIVAAPDLDVTPLIQQLNAGDLGICALPFTFIPYFYDLKGQICHGMQVHVTNYQQVNGLYIGLIILYFLRHHYPKFEWTASKGIFWIDRLTGSDIYRKAIDEGQSFQDILNVWAVEKTN